MVIFILWDLIQSFYQVKNNMNVNVNMNRKQSNNVLDDSKRKNGINGEEGEEVGKSSE